VGVLFLLFLFSLCLKRFHPYLHILGLFHHIKELFTGIFICELSNVKLDASKFLDKSRWFSFFNFKVVLINIWKSMLNGILIKEYFNSWICKHTTLLTLFFNIMMWNINSKLPFLIYNPMGCDDSCTIVNFQVCTFIKESDVHGPIIHLFIRIEERFAILFDLTLVCTVFEFVCHMIRL